MPYGMEPLDVDEVTQCKPGDDAVTIRRARPADGPALERLAALDSAALLAGDLLLAEVEGAPWAALSLHDGRVVSDPYRPAAAARALLELRADHLAEAADRGGRRRRQLLAGPHGLARVLRLM